MVSRVCVDTVCVCCDCSVVGHMVCSCSGVFFFQAEDGIRDLVRSRGLGDVYKRQDVDIVDILLVASQFGQSAPFPPMRPGVQG